MMVLLVKTEQKTFSYPVQKTKEMIRYGFLSWMKI